MARNIAKQRGMAAPKMTASQEQPPRICNRAGAEWKKQPLPCECHLWPKWVMSNVGTTRCRVIVEATDNEGTFGSYDEGSRVAYFRPARSGEYGYYNGMVVRAYRVQFPTGAWREVVGIN